MTRRTLVVALGRRRLWLRVPRKVAAWLRRCDWSTDDHYGY